MGGTNRARVVIRHKAKDCIGCCLCAEIVPQYFQMNGEGLAVLQDGEKRGVFFHAGGLAVDREDLENAVDGCPVDIIRVDQT